MLYLKLIFPQQLVKKRKEKEKKLMQELVKVPMSPKQNTLPVALVIK